LINRQRARTRLPGGAGIGLGGALYLAWGALLLFFVGGCGSSPVVPESPTWADVEPILRGECASCHGGSAATTGSARGVIYRLDFYDLDPATCGDAAAATEAARFAAAASSQIAFDITSVSASIRPRMPPAPGPSLADWEWKTLLRWADNPQRGPEPNGNRPPVIRVTTSNRLVTTNSFNLSVVLEDPDGDSAVGVLTIGDVTLKMDRPGAFSIDIDASLWPLGPTPVQATVCDGWRRTSYPNLASFAIGG
jgi:hypothetical protein